MKFGVYGAILHDRPIAEAIETVAALGLSGIEINSGGFLDAVHLPDYEDILLSNTARDDYLGLFAKNGVTIAGLNCNGNPLHPKPDIGTKHSNDILKSIKLAARLGQNRVVTMSGLPAGELGGSVCNWVVNAWNSSALDVLDYQWSAAKKFWKEADALAGDLGVKVALELHPQNLVFNVPTIHEFIERIGTKNIGVELDASHLFWQQMDPVAVAEDLGDLVLQVAAKDVRINHSVAKTAGVLDNSFRRMSSTEPRVNLGGDEWVNEWPSPSAWDFVAVGKGHDSSYWAKFLQVCESIDNQMWINIEHEDTSMGRIEGLEFACATLFEAQRIISEGSFAQE